MIWSYSKFGLSSTRQLLANEASSNISCKAQIVFRTCFTKAKLRHLETLFFVMRCAIWYLTLKNSVPTVGQNAVLTS